MVGYSPLTFLRISLSFFAEDSPVAAHRVEGTFYYSLQLRTVDRELINNS